MTTAHRATWKAARGGLQEEGSFTLHAPSAAVSAKDAPTERHLKLRHVLTSSHHGQDAAAIIDADADVNVDVDVGGAEKRYGPGEGRGEGRLKKRMRRTRFASANFSTPTSTKANESTQVEKSTKVDNNNDDVDDNDIRPVNGDSSTRSLTSGDDDVSDDTVRNNIETGTQQQHEQHDHQVESESESDDDSSSSEDEAELRAEVERIRKERELERIKRETDEEQKRLQAEDEHVANANPLLGNLSHRSARGVTPSTSSRLQQQQQQSAHDDFSDTASIMTGTAVGTGGGFTVRRRWDDDVVFRNQASGSHANERVAQARFINDTIHNDFHRRFMKRYMR